jgi:ribonuclease P protein subunit RPR2
MKLNSEQKTKRKKQRRRGRVGRRTKDMVDIGKERIKILLTLAEREALQNKNEVRARRYVLLARKIAMRYNIRIEKSFKHKICRKCNSFLITDSGCRIRLQGGKIIKHCKSCGRITRMPIHDRAMLEKVK